MSLSGFFSTISNWLPIVIVIGGLTIVHLIVNIVYKRAYPKQIEKKRKWAQVILKTLNRPFKMLIWFSGVSTLVSLYAHYIFDVSALNMISKLIRVGFISSLMWAFYIFVKETERSFLLKKNYDKTTVELLSKLSLMVIVLVTLLLILPLFGIQIAGLLAFGGLSGIIVGLSAQTAIANVLGGIIIAVDKPFKIGEAIISLDGNIEGVVEHIGWRMTQIRRYDKKLLFIPNSNFSSMMFINHSRMTNRRIYKTIGIRYDDIGASREIMREVREFIKESDLVDHKQYNFIHLENFGTSSVDLLLRIYLKTTVYKDYREQTEAILLRVHEIIEKHGAQIAFPTSTLYLQQNQDGVDRFEELELDVDKKASVSTDGGRISPSTQQ